jgi:hypothetical protein
MDAFETQSNSSANGHTLSEKECKNRVLIPVKKLVDVDQFVVLVYQLQCREAEIKAFGSRVRNGLKRGFAKPGKGKEVRSQD